MKYRFRVRYWVWVNEHFGEWHTTGLMKKREAELVKRHLEISHDKVEVYKDE
jgi:hypothetical protein